MADSHVSVGGGGGAGGPGPQGPEGDSLRLIFIRSSTTPTNPTGGSWDGNTFTPPTGWTTTIPTGSNNLYSAAVVLHTSDNTASYSTAFRVTGAGTDGAKGDSLRLIYRRTATTLTATPTGGSWNGTTFTPPTNWSTAIPAAPPAHLYASATTLSGDNSTITYTPPFRISGGAADGAIGTSIRLIYIRSTSTPTAPTDGSWNGTTFTPPTGWSNVDPGGTNPLYAATAHLVHTTSSVTPTYDTPFRITGDTGSTGDSTRLIYTKNSSTPTNPSGGTWNGTTLDPPTNWHLTIPAGNDDLYSAVATLGGDGSSLSYSDAFKLTGEIGATGTSLTVIYRKHTSAPTTPTGGTWDGTNFTAPSNWSLTVPSGTNPLYGVAVRLGSDNSTITYSAPFRLTGVIGVKGDSIRLLFRRKADPAPTTPADGSWDGTDFTAPADWTESIPTGSDPLYWLIARLDSSDNTVNYIRVQQFEQGPRGDSIQLIYTTQSEGTTPSVPGQRSGASWNGTTFTPPLAWSATVPTVSTGNVLWTLAVTLSGDDTTFSYGSSVIRLTGNVGVKGDSIRLLFRRSTTGSPTAPTDGSWDGTTFTAPTNWTEAVPTSSGTLYWIIARLDSSSNTIAYGSVQLYERGQQGHQGDSFDLVYQRATASTTPGTGGVRSGGTLTTAPTGWSLSASTAPGTITDPLYVSIVHLPGDSATTINYDTSFEITGPAGEHGDSVRLIYRKSSTSLTAAPTGGTWNGTTFTPPNNWSLTILAGTDPLYGVIANLDGDNSSVSYSTPFRLTQAGSGNHGDSVDIIYQRSSSTPSKPADDTGTRTGLRITTAPAGWSLTVAGTTGNNPLYVAFATLSGGSSTSIVYDDPIKVEAEDGNAGDSFILVYQRATNTPAVPTGGTWDGSTFTPQSPWTLSISGGTNPLFASVAKLDGDGTTITYSAVFRLTGEDGDPGDSIRLIYRRATSEPTAPTGGSWNGTLFTLPSNWTESIPTSSNPLWIVPVRLHSDNTTITYNNVLRFSALDGSDGDSLRMIYYRSASTPTTPGLGTWNGTTFTPPSPWTLTVPTGNNPLYGIVATLDGDGTTVTQSAIIRLTGPSGGASGEDGDSFVLIYQKTNTEPDTPMAGTWDGTTFGPPSNWSTTVPGGNEPLFASVAKLDGDGTTITYSDVFRMTGIAGTNGVSIDLVYRRSSTNLATAPPTTGLTATNGVLSAAPSGWDLNVPSGSDDLYISIATITGTGTITFSVPTRLSGSTGEDGNSLTVIYRRKADPAPTAPASGTWNGTAFTPPTDWTLTIPTGNDPLYGIIVTLGGDDSTVTQSAIIKLTGEKGDQGDSLRVIYRRGDDTPNAPTGGSWTRSSSSFGVPTGWSISIPAGTNNVYASFITLSGSSDTIARYGEVFLISEAFETVGPTTYTINYGLATSANVPATTPPSAVKTATFTGLPATVQLLFPPATSTNPHWYFTLPAGVTFSHIYNTAVGRVLADSDWTIDSGNSQKRNLTSTVIGFGGMYDLEVT